MNNMNWFAIVMMMIQNYWLMFAISLCFSHVYARAIVGGSIQTRVERSAIENLRDPGIYIIYFKSNVTEIEQQHFVALLETKSKMTREFAAEIIEKFFIIKCLIVKLSKEARALDWVRNQEIVQRIKENEYINIGSENKTSPQHVTNSENITDSSSPWLMSPWHLDKIGQVTLSNKTNNTLTGKGIDVYVLDSGIHYEHEEFNGRALYPGCDPIDRLYGESQAGRDCEGHGTHVAGLVGGKSTGVANGVTIFSVRILDCALKGSEASLLYGLMCVINHRKSRNGTRAIINLSVAGVQTSLAVNKSLQLALDNDIIITASAGNGNDQFRLVSYDSCKAYPAGYPGVINVGATDIHDDALMGEFDSMTYITNMGKCLDVFAPGYNVYSSDICPFLPCPVGNDECTTRNIANATCKNVRSGTSQSSPIVAGAVALLLEKCPKLTHIQIKNVLRYFLSTSSVQFCKPFEYSKKLSLINVIVTLINTRDSLLYVGGIFDTTYCNLFSESSLALL